MKKKSLIVLAGPTAVGKTELSISLAKAAGCEIISADSMQAYRQMDIGTAKIQKERMCGVRHHLIDILSPTEKFDVSRFQKLAKCAAEEIYDRGNIPLVVGGTGFYIQALLYDVDFFEEPGDGRYRRSLETIAQEHGGKALLDMLREVDAESAETIHPNNVKRLIRALEYYHIHKTPISAHNREAKRKESPYNFAYFVLNDERSRLYAAIDRRVDEMMEQGLLQEVQKLREQGYTRADVSMQGLGYKELLAYLEGECSLEEAVYVIKRETRHFAKRQLTWFHRERDVIWLEKSAYNYSDEKILKEIVKILQEKEIL